MAQAGGGQAEFVDGERVLLRGKLDRAHWMCWRSCQCIVADPCFWLSGLPLGALLYCAFGRSCREAEADSFELALTDTALHFKQKTYSCGFCCHNSVQKVVPLDKIQDVMLVATCCADTCGFAPQKGRPYQLQVQTAGMGVPQAELIVFCLQDIEQFRQEVLAAKRRVTGGAGTVGAAKGAAVTYGPPGSGEPVVSNPLTTASSAPFGGYCGPATGTGGDSAAVVAVLERIERALNDGLAQFRAQQGYAYPQLPPRQ